MAEWPKLATELKDRDLYIKRISQKDNIPVEKVRQTVAGVKGNDSTGQKWVSYPYHEERQQFNSMVDELFEKNKDDFESREEVFRLFAEATVSGRLLPVARLIEKTFGKGSFRLISKKSADMPDREASI